MNDHSCHKKNNTNKNMIQYLVYTLMIVLIILSFQSVHATTTTNNKSNVPSAPLNIKSDKQSFNLKTNTATFTGHVIVTRDKTIIKANQAVLTKHANGTETVDASGQPVTFSSELNNGKIVTGNALKLYYDMAKDYIILEGNASLKQDDNHIQGELIHYSIKNEEMTASGNKNKQVRTVIIPSELKQSNAQK